MSDPNFQTFDSMEQMIEFMTANEEAANARAAQEQKQITYGDYWCRFYDIEHRVVIFGWVMPQEELLRTETELAGPEEGPEDVEYTIAQMAESHARGYMYGWCYSILEPQGEPGSTHQANLWPIDASLYEAAKTVGWNIDALPAPARTQLQAAYQAWRSYMLRAIEEARGG